MRFIVNMAWREMRTSWQRLLLFFLCIAVGVGSIICLRSLVQKMKLAIAREARVMYRADAIALTWALSKYSIKVAWQPVPSINFISVVVTLLLVVVVGVASSWDVIVKKPLVILRAE
jgi:predicted lysophospholipase L1 biosynthesis ABC-type transport system permease subunit